MGVPARGLLNYPQVERLYEELDLQDRLVDVRKAGFGKHLVEAVLSDLTDLPALRGVCTERVARLHEQARVTLTALADWLHLNLH
jgi:hypothetical protein